MWNYFMICIVLVLVLQLELKVSFAVYEPMSLGEA